MSTILKKNRIIALASAVTGAVLASSLLNVQPASAQTTPSTVKAVIPTSTLKTITTSVDDFNLSFTGTWLHAYSEQKYQQYSSWTGQKGVSFSYEFEGTGVEVFAPKASWLGQAQVNIDGVSEGIIDYYSPTRLEQASVFKKTNLSNGKHKITVTTLGTKNPASSNTTVTVDRLDIFSLEKSPFVGRVGNQLVLNGKPFRFAGTNEYYLGLDDNIRDAQGQPTYPTEYRIDNALDSAVKTGATVVRSHTLGISVGCAKCLEPQLDVFNDKAFETMDYAIAQAKNRGLKVMIPLTDQWRFYHGGISVFTGWYGYPNNPDWKQNAGNNLTQRASEANFYTDQRVINAYKRYISHLMNHVNPYTGVAYKNEPTIMAWETGNEIWSANQQWTDDIARYIKKDIGAEQLIADGTASSGSTVGKKAALTSTNIDIVGGHFYPIDVNFMRNDAAIAAANNKAYVVGEFDWTNTTATKELIKEVESNSNIAGDLYWVLLPYMENGKPEPHGDRFRMYSPAVDTTSASVLAYLTTHGQKMKQFNQ